MAKKEFKFDFLGRELIVEIGEVARTKQMELY